MAREIARGLLANREGVARRPTDAEVADLMAKGVRATCDSRGGDRFDCAIHVGGFPPYSCTAVVTGGHANDLRCGSGTEAPRVADTFVDCARVGKVKTVSDPGNETTPATDLTAVGVARGEGKLCVNFSFATTPDRQTLVTFIARPAGATEPPSEILAATVNRAEGEPQVTTINHGSIVAAVGTRGDELSLVIERSALVPALQYLFEKPFQFAAHTALGSQANPTAQDDLASTADQPQYP